MPIRSALLALLATAVVACSSIPPAEPLDLPQSQVECERAGFVWDCRGIPGEGCPKMCQRPTTDVGKVCTHRTQCQGQCVAETISAKTGRCSASTKFQGCAYYLDEVRRPGGGLLCYD